MIKAMIKDNELKKWIESAHFIFEIFEGRYDVYPLAKKWIDEWFERGKFTVLEDDKRRLDNLKASFNYKAFGIQDNAMKTRIDSQFTEILTTIKNGQRANVVGFAVAPYLITWDFRRFKEYFRKVGNFSVPNYFQSLSKFIEEKREEFKKWRKKKLVDDKIDETPVIAIFNNLNNKLKQLGIKDQNEPVGTAKLLHILAPSYFPLIDNPIAQAVGLKNRGESLSSSHYFKWIIYLQNWFMPRREIIESVETEFNQSILKLVDEGFYVMSSINLSLRLVELGVIPQG